MLNHCVGAKNFFSPITSIQSHGLPIVFECEQAGVVIATIVIHQNPEYFCADRFRQHLDFFTANYSPLKVSLFQREQSKLRVRVSRGWSKEGTERCWFYCCCPCDPLPNRNDAKLVVRPFTTDVDKTVIRKINRQDISRNQVHRA